MNKNSKLAYLLITLLFFICFDIYFSNLLLNSRTAFPSNSVLDIIYVQNTGAAFNIFENSTIFLIGFALMAIVLVFSYIIKNINKASYFAVFWVSMLIAGITCNMYERIAFGFVRDFFKLNFINFPVFNFSDIFINISVFALIIIIVKNKYLKK